jgi:hypothetical protein
MTPFFRSSAAPVVAGERKNQATPVTPSASL